MLEFPLALYVSFHWAVIHPLVQQAIQFVYGPHPAWIGDILYCLWCLIGCAGSRSSILCLMGLSGGMPCGSVNMSWYSSHSLFQRVVVFVSCLCFGFPLCR